MANVSKSEPPPVSGAEKSKPEALLYATVVSAVVALPVLMMSCPLNTATSAVKGPLFVPEIVRLVEKSELLPRVLD